MHGDTAVQYEGFGSLSELDNETIRCLSEGKAIEDRSDLVQWLSQIPDELALHGLYHTDYSTMSARDQDQDMAEGLALMKRLFPKKRIRYFIAPFNRTNAATCEVAARHGLAVLAAEGIHLEEQLDRLEVRPRTWYRYHHHRFYPESRVTYYDLSMEKLDAALARNFNVQLNHTGVAGAPGSMAPLAPAPVMLKSRAATVLARLIPLLKSPSALARAVWRQARSRAFPSNAH